MVWQSLKENSLTNLTFDRSFYVIFICNIYKYLLLAKKTQMTKCYKRIKNNQQITVLFILQFIKIFLFHLWFEGKLDPYYLFMVILKYLFRKHLQENGNIKLNDSDFPIDSKSGKNVKCTLCFISLNDQNY